MRPWKESEDLLFRGDSVEIPDPPKPNADDSLVRHILQVDGPGQQTPFLSTTESEVTARYFALPKGFVLSTTVPVLREAELGYIGKKELLQLLVSRGKGDAKWHSAAEVKRAAQLVEQHAEHLADARSYQGKDDQQLQEAMRQSFSVRRPL
mgnify:CR=1 FL=1